MPNKPISRHPFFRRALLLGGALLMLAWLFRPAPAAAHPLGNFSVNHFTRLEISAETIRLNYIVDMAEIPAFQEKQLMDTDHNGSLSEQEQTAYRAAQGAALHQGLTLHLNGEKQNLVLESTRLTFPPGQGGLETMRLEIWFTTPVPAGSGRVTLYFLDGNYADRLGWQEIVAQPADNITLLDSNVPQESISQDLTVYPEDLLQDVLKVSEARLTFSTGTGGLSLLPAGLGLTNQAPGNSDGGRFNQSELAELIHIPAGPGPLAAAMLLAFALGSLHALSPGHGKTIVGAYLVGSRGTARHALFLGLTTTITHTAGVFAFGLLVLFASRFIVPERLYPWLGVISGLLVVSIGFSLFRGRWRGLRRPAENPAGDNPGYHVHFGGVGHSHLPPENETGQLRWHNLLALGVSGGLLPCPSALILLLSAIALQRVGLGIFLIVIFSLGLASVLTAIGLVMVYAGHIFSHFSDRFPGAGRSHLIFRLVPTASALFITLAGLGITLQALWQAAT